MSVSDTLKGLPTHNVISSAPERLCLESAIDGCPPVAPSSAGKHTIQHLYPLSQSGCTQSLQREPQVNNIHHFVEILCEVLDHALQSLMFVPEWYISRRVKALLVKCLVSKPSQSPSWMTKLQRQDPEMTPLRYKDASSIHT